MPHTVCVVLGGGNIGDGGGGVIGVVIRCVGDLVGSGSIVGVGVMGDSISYCLLCEGRFHRCVGGIGMICSALANVIRLA